MDIERKSIYEHAEYENFNGATFFCVKNKSLKQGDVIKTSYHEQFEIKYIISGKMNVICDSNVFTAAEGDIVIINPYERHFVNISESDNVEYHLFMIDLSQFSAIEFFKNYFKQLLDNIYFFKNLIRNDDVNRKFLDIIESFNESEDNNDIEVFAKFLFFYSHLLQEYKYTKYETKQNLHKNSYKENIVSNALEYVHNHYNENIKLDDLSKRSHITNEHFCRIFKNVTGKSPISYLIEYRINKAIVLFKNTNKTVNEVALEVGFNDTSYFCRCFKKSIGNSPTDFIQNFTRKEDRDE